MAAAHSSSPPRAPQEARNDDPTRTGKFLIGSNPGAPAKCRHDGARAQWCAEITQNARMPTEGQQKAFRLLKVVPTPFRQSEAARVTQATARQVRDAVDLLTSKRRLVKTADGYVWLWELE